MKEVKSAHGSWLILALSLAAVAFLLVGRLSGWLQTEADSTQQPTQMAVDGLSVPITIIDSDEDGHGELVIVTLDDGTQLIEQVERDPGWFKNNSSAVIVAVLSAGATLAVARLNQTNTRDQAEVDRRLDEIVARMDSAENET